MTTRTETSVTTQVYRVYIKATPQAIWDAITSPEWTARYGMGGSVEYDLRAGGLYRAYPSEAMRRKGAEMGFPIPDVAIDGEVIEADPPHKLVQTYRVPPDATAFMLMGDEQTAAEGSTRLTWEIEEVRPPISKLTVIHELEGAPRLASMLSGDMESRGAGGGWSYILSDLKTLLETGRSLRA